MTSCPFPIGFGGFFQTDPNTIYSGTTWEQKKDVFILAAGDTYPAGSTGGEAQHTLTMAEMPKHNHSLYYDYDTVQHDVTKHVFQYGAYVPTNIYSLMPNAVEPYGSSQPHNNMPPYFAMPFWVRTA